MQAKNNATTPFAQTTFFDPNGQVNASGILNMTGLEDVLRSRFARNDTFVFLRIDRTFGHMKVRRVPAQAVPYPPLADMVDQQVVFDHRNISGTLIGLWSPGYAGTLSSLDSTSISRATTAPRVATCSVSDRTAHPPRSIMQTVWKWHWGEVRNSQDAALAKVR